MKSFFVAISGFISILYLLNPTAGLIELIPDNIPFVGNIDEAGAVAILLSSINYFLPKPVVGKFNKAIAIISGLVALVYLANPSAGFIEMLPDNIPGLGNLDEAAASTILLFALRQFGLNFTSLFKKKKLPPKAT